MLRANHGGYSWREIKGPNGEVLYFDSLRNILLNKNGQDAVPRGFRPKPGGQYPGPGNTGRNMGPVL